jgi:hypothetical protein
LGRRETPNEFERAEYLESVRSIFHRLSGQLSEIHKLDVHRSAIDVFQDAGHILLKTALKNLCAKSYDCDIVNYSYRMNRECRWAEIYPHLVVHKS